MRHFIFFILFFTVFLGKAATVDTISIYSSAMKQSFKCVVIKPADYGKAKQPFPVVYLLHGFSGNYSNWIIKVPAIKTYADKYEMVIVCPDGGYSSWYFDSPLDSAMRYETYIGKEVPAYIEKHYQVQHNRKGRFITGLSMGGHGAFYLALRHPGIFGGCGSMSGGLDINDSRNKYDIGKRIGDTLHYAENWKKYTVINMVDKYPADSLAMIFDCGTDDFYFNANKRFHEKLLKLKVPHEFIIRPGSHNWDYWANAIEYQLLFFKKLTGQ